MGYGFKQWADTYLTKSGGKFTTAILASLPAGFLAASATGLAKMADGYFAVSAAALAKFADGFFSVTAAALAKFADGFWTADAAGRAKFGDGIWTELKLASNAMTAKILANLTPLAAAGALAAVNVGMPVMIVLDCPDVATGDLDFTALPFKIQVTGVDYIKTGGAGDAGNSHTVKNGANAITGALNSAVDTTVVPATTLDDANWTIAAAGTIRVSVVKIGGSSAARIIVRGFRSA
jgi:hypothetical protein